MDSARWRRVRPLLEHALELAHGERGRWLAELAARERELHDDVARLLARQAEPDLLERAAATLARLQSRHA